MSARRCFAPACRRLGRPAILANARGAPDPRGGAIADGDPRRARGGRSRPAARPCATIVRRTASSAISSMPSRSMTARARLPEAALPRHDRPHDVQSGRSTFYCPDLPDSERGRRLREPPSFIDKARRGSYLTGNPVSARKQAFWPSFRAFCCRRRAIGAPSAPCERARSRRRTAVERSKMLGAVKFDSVMKRVFGSSNDRRLKGYRPKVAAINALEPEFEALSDEAVAGRRPTSSAPNSPPARRSTISSRPLSPRCARRPSARSSSAISTCS